MSEHYTLHVNGVDHEVADAWVGENLLYVLRERLGMFGAKGACEQGECGSCTVIVGGRVVCACLVLAASAVGQPIVTVEGLAADGLPSDVQQAFVDADDLLERNPDPTDMQIREELSGNVCRCTGYGRIIEAVQRVCVGRASS